MKVQNNQLVVTCIDKFMSGWGHAESKKNKLILLCDNHDEAGTVEQNARDRGDQSHVKITTLGKALAARINAGNIDFNHGDHYVQVKTNDDYSSWYKAGYFRKHDEA